MGFSKQTFTNQREVEVIASFSPFATSAKPYTTQRQRIAAITDLIRQTRSAVTDIPGACSGLLEDYAPETITVLDLLDRLETQTRQL